MHDDLSVARGAAERLSGRYGERLPIELEKLIVSDGKTDVKQFSVSDAMAIASFVLSVAQFLYEIYKDKAKSTADNNAIKREMRITIQAPPQITAQQKNDVIDAVVEEASSAGRRS